MKKMGKKTKRLGLVIPGIAVIGLIAMLTFSYLYPEYPRYGTAREQTDHITRILEKNDLDAEIRLCEQISSEIKDPETTSLLLDQLQLEALYIMAKDAEDWSTGNWHSFFFSSLLHWSNGFTPLVGRLTREIETGDSGTIRKVGVILPAVIHNMNFGSWANVNEGSIAGDLIEKDRLRWEKLLNSFLTSAQADPETVAEADRFLVFLAERTDEHNIDVPTHISVNPSTPRWTHWGCDDRATGEVE